MGITEIAAAPDVQYIDVEAWGGFLRLGSLTAGDMIEFIEANEGPAKKTAGLRLIINSLVDENGNRIGDEKRDLPMLRKKDSKTCNMLVQKILDLNGLDKKNEGGAKNGSSEANTDASPTA